MTWNKDLAAQRLLEIAAEMARAGNHRLRMLTLIEAWRAHDNEHRHLFVAALRAEHVVEARIAYEADLCDGKQVVAVPPPFDGPHKDAVVIHIELRLASPRDAMRALSVARRRALKLLFTEYNNGQLDTIGSMGKIRVAVAVPAPDAPRRVAESIATDIMVPWLTLVSALIYELHAYVARAGKWPSNVSDLRLLVQGLEPDALLVSRRIDLNIEQPIPLPILLQWLDVRTRAGSPWPETPDRLSTEIDHSIRGGLLGWMLEGHEPLPAPPPLSMSRPAHAWVAAGQGDPFEVWEPAPEDNFHDDGIPELLIDQHPWKLVERLPHDRAWLVQPFQGRTRQLGDGIWLVRQTGTRLDMHTCRPVAPGNLDRIWELRRLGEADAALDEVRGIVARIYEGIA